jgi:hypothetical protein
MNIGCDLLWIINQKLISSSMDILVSYILGVDLALTRNIYYIFIIACRTSIRFASEKKKKCFAWKTTLKDVTLE